VYRWFHSWNVPVRDEGGNIVRWFGTLLDVNDQKLAEDALRKTDKLAAVGRLAASISHEINNPLEAVMNLVFLAKNDRMISPQSREFLGNAERELARVSQIATQTLRFYRQSSRPTRVNLGETMNSVLTLYEGRLTNSQVEAIREYGDRDYFVEALEGELRQVIANLVANAIDANRPGGRIRVRVSASRDWKSGGNCVRLSIADTGHGISPELRARIFEPFFTTKTNTGTGLGLWVTREIIDKHHGSIRVRSRQGEGTVFSVLLPEIFSGDKAN
jgi:signal transduction histidine kinase